MRYVDSRRVPIFIVILQVNGFGGDANFFIPTVHPSIDDAYIIHYGANLDENHPLQLFDMIQDKIVNWMVQYQIRPEHLNQYADVQIKPTTFSTVPIPNGE